MSETSRDTGGLFAVDTRTPTVPESGAYWIAPSATVVGDVHLHEDASVWFSAVLRADDETITVGARSNVQDGAVLHVDPGYPLTLGADCTVGHLAMLHGCTVGDCTLIGIGAAVLNGARIGRNCIIGAHALVTEGTEIPDNSLVVGAPGKVIRTRAPEDADALRQSATTYVRRWRRYAQGLRPVSKGKETS